MMNIITSFGRMPWFFAIAVALMIPSSPHAQTQRTETTVEPLPTQAKQNPTVLTVPVDDLMVTAIYDGYVPILTADLHGASEAFMKARLTEAALPVTGDMKTSVNAFLVRRDKNVILIDTGSGNSLGPNTGAVLQNLKFAGISAGMVNSILITHLHPDHVRGLILNDGRMAYPNATVYVSKEDLDYWLDPQITRDSTGVQRQIHDWASEALMPYLRQNRVRTFQKGDVLFPGVKVMPLNGHTPGHTAFIFDSGDSKLLFWGDTIHSPAIQLADPKVSIAIDSNEKRAVQARVGVLREAAANQWWVAAAHMPFPGIGKIKGEGNGYQWLPVSYSTSAGD